MVGDEVRSGGDFLVRAIKPPDAMQKNLIKFAKTCFPHSLPLSVIGKLDYQERSACNFCYRYAIVIKQPWPLLIVFSFFF